MEYYHPQIAARIQKTLIPHLRFGFLLAALCATLVAPSATAVTVTTATGAGADAEVNENSTSFDGGSGTGLAVNARISNVVGSERNEYIALRFDLTGQTLAALTNVSLELVNYRTNGAGTVLQFYGVTAGTVGKDGNGVIRGYTAENWNEADIRFSTLPGLDWDGIVTTRSQDLPNLTDLGTVAHTPINEGTSLVFSNAALTAFVQAHPTNRITFLIMRESTNSGQARFASKEASATVSNIVSGAVGDFAPRLRFDVTAAESAPTISGLTNLTVTPGVNVTLSPVISGSPPPEFQWRENGTNIANATNSALPLVNAQLTENGFTYSLIASNSLGVVTNSMILTVTNAANGFATVGGICTGGQGGAIVTVSNGTDFKAYAESTTPYIIQVKGPITTGQVSPRSNKTIIGADTNATILGYLAISGVTNVIVQNLRVTNPGNDGISIISGSRNVWVDHVTFYDCGDGCCDATVQADNITVSWCKFYYTTNQIAHRFTFLVSASELETLDDGKLHITVHHNWWSTRADQRMLAVRRGSIHYYNNYFSCSNNLYCSNARTNAQFLSESNYYSGVKSPIYKESNGLIKTSGNIYSGVNPAGGQAIAAGTDTVFTPPYSYTPDSAASVPATVMAGAGAPGPDAVAIPPKVWSGGASGNWNSSNNWVNYQLKGETPKEYDTLVFAGDTRLNTTNNFSSGLDYPGLAFSNNAGTFNLRGNPIFLGGSIIDDSANVQTINLDMGFNYATDHFSSNRTFAVNAPGGSLILNSRLSGTNNAFISYYPITKSGPGLLTIAGINTATCSYLLNGGLLQFSTLDTNNPGSLGDVTSLAFNSGGLRWLPGNAADISAFPVTINAGGGTLDTGTNDVLLSSRIGNNGIGSLTKLGAGRLTISATNNYKGNTVIGQGTFALSATAALTNSPQIIVSNSATLDASALVSGLLLRNGQTLAGNGLVLGSVTLTNGATLVPGASPGILTLSNSLTLLTGSTTRMELDKSVNTNDLITGLSTVSYGGNLVVTNLSGTLAVNDNFKLFSAASFTGSFNSITLPTLSGGLIWTNMLAIDGTIAVVSPVNTTPTNITALVSGGTLELSWPPDHIGWSLQTQTNALSTGLATNWLTLPGYESTNAATIPIGTANPTVFYRLFYAVP